MTDLAIWEKRLIPLLPVRLDIDLRNATVSAGGLRKSQRSPCLIRAFQQWEGTQHHAHRSQGDKPLGEYEEDDSKRLSIFQ